MKGASDLNGEERVWQSSGFSFGGCHEHRQNAVRSTHGLPLPWKTFHRIVDRCGGDRYVKSMTCADQFCVMAFAQLTYRESLRDIEVCLSAQSAKLYHMGLRQETKRSTLADANEARDWRIHAEFAQRLIEQARKLYVDDSFGIELENTAYALDSTIIDLCLSLFPWALFRTTKSAVKMHTLLDLRGNIPSFIHISDGKLGDVNMLDILVLEAGAIYIMDRGYLDFARLYVLHQAQAFFVTRAKSNTRLKRVYSAQVDHSAGIICNQTVALTGTTSRKNYPEHLRRIRYKDTETGKKLVFLTNNFSLPAATICALYKARRQVELFFKWIKQHLRIKKFYGSSENAVKSQIWIAVSVYVLVAIVKKRLNLDASLYILLQIFSLILFKKMPIQQAFPGSDYKSEQDNDYNQLNLLVF
ncbi:transposase [Candidatus Nitrotoga sp. 1052]|nr:transposase [Candidatus Nitrotoga sp. 1052]